jgi:hypothetical protein
MPKSCTVIENIRPTAITSIFFKIQESYALEWMLDDAKDNISRRQVGGIPGSSPILALLEMLHNWYSVMENSDTVIHVDRNILLSDLEKIGVKADFQSSHKAPRSSLRVMHEHFHPITMLNSSF